MSEFNLLPHRDRPATRPEFDEAYTGIPPWEIGRPQPAMVELFDRGEVSGSVLDAGCGTAELALLAASRGLDATGVDASPRAIDIARRKAAERNLAVRLEVGNVLDLGFLGAKYDTVLDSGVLHVFDDDDRVRYLNSIHGVLVPGGRYHLLVFSDAQPGDWGPRRMRRDELEMLLAGSWEVRSIEARSLDINLFEGHARGWRATAVRRK